MTLSLQASLLCNPSLSLPLPLPKPRFHRSSSLYFNPSPLPKLFRPSTFLFYPRHFSSPCTLHPDNVNSDSKVDYHVEDSKALVSDFEGGHAVGGFENESDGIELNNIDGETENGVESERQNDKLVGNEGPKSKIPAMVFLMGVWAMIKNGMEKLMALDWFSWWPFWRQEKRLDHLIAEADANPKDAAKQSALLAELNKHRFSFSLLLLINFKTFFISLNL